MRKQILECFGNEKVFPKFIVFQFEESKILDDSAPLKSGAVYNIYFPCNVPDYSLLA